MARKRLNKRLVIAVTLFVFVAAIILSALMLRQLQRGDPKRFVALAVRYGSEEAWEQAALFYRKAWENSGDPAYLVKSGEMLLEGGEVRQALAFWRQALVGDPSLVDAHMKRIELLLELASLLGSVDEHQALRDAAAALIEVDAELTPAQRAFARNANGVALINLASQNEANVENGLAELRKAVELAPDNVDYAIELAMSYARLQRHEEAREIFREYSDRFDSPSREGAKIHSAYARYLAEWPDEEDRAGSFEQAEQLFERSLALALNAPAALRGAKLHYAVLLSQRWAESVADELEASASQPLFDHAETLLLQCIEADPDAFDAYVRLATLYKMARRHADVVRLCDERVGRGFSRKGVQAVRDKASAFRLLILASEACVAQAVTASEEGKGERKGELIAEARRYMNDAGAEFPNHPDVLSQSGRLKLALGQERSALEDLRQAYDAYRAKNLVNWENTLILARLHLKLNEPGAAKDIIERVWGESRQSRNTPLLLAYAEALLRTNDADRALAVVDSVLLRHPSNADARRIKAAVYALQGRPHQAGSLVDSLAMQAMLEAQALSVAGDAAGAVTVRLKALEQNPADVQLVGATVSELLRLNRAAEAQTVLKRAIAADPDSTVFKRLMVLATKGLSDEERDAAVLEIIEDQPDRYRRALDLVDFYARKDDAASALTYLDEAERHLIDRDTPLATNATPAHHRTLLEAKVRFAAALDDEEAMEQARNAAEKYNVDAAGGKTILALYHMQRGEMEPAIAALRAVVELQPTDAVSLTRLGQCLQRTNRNSEARLYYEQAIRINPNEAHAHRGLAALAKSQGDSETYDVELELCGRLIPDDPWVKAELLARQEEADPKSAITRREALLKEHPDDTHNLFRLARLCEAAGEIPDADRYWENLLALVTRQEDRNMEQGAVVAAAKYYRRTGRPEKSLRLVTRFAESGKTDEERADAQVLVAAHYLSQGQLDLVKTTLLAAADIAPTFEIAYSIGEFYLRTADRPEAALEWFDRAVELARRDKLPQLRNVLITRITCLLHRSLDDLESAQKHVAEFIAEYPDDPQGQLLASEVHARKGEISEAVAALSEFLEKEPGHLYARIKRAQHYASLGHLTDAIEDLEVIKRSGAAISSQIAPRILLARLRFHAGRRDAWLRELQSLVEDAPDSTQAFTELVRAYMIEERFDDADTALTSRINRSADKPDPRWFFLRGQVSLEVKDYNRALADFRRGAQLSDFSSESLRRVLDTYWRAKRYQEGIEFYKQHADAVKNDPAVVSRYARLLASAGREPEAVEAFRRAMYLAIEDTAVSVRSVTADLRSAPWSVEHALTLFDTPVPAPEAARANDRILVRLYSMSDRAGEAAAKLDHLIHNTTRDALRADLLVERAELHQVLHDYEKTRRDYEEALKYDSDNWIIMNNLAYVLADKLNNSAVALPYAKKAVALSNAATALDTLGWIYTGLGQYSAAIAELSRAIRLDTSLTIAYYHLGETRRRNGEFLEAKLVLDEGLTMAKEAREDSLVALFEAALEKTQHRTDTP
ncbi:MAG: tetratricopeptide repeat protein [Phycisphaerae bacterium]